MGAPTLTYTLTNGQTADASQLMQDLNDLLNGITDGTKDLSISALTCAGTATFNGNVNIGNASSDDLSITASLASTIPVKTDDTYNIGSSTLRLATVYSHKYYGTVTNDAAGVGEIGRFIQTGIARGSRVSFGSTGVTQDFISMVIEGGDWLVGGLFGITGAAGTTCSQQIAWITSAAVTLPTPDQNLGMFWLSGTGAGIGSGDDAVHAIPAQRITLTTATTHYLGARYGFAVASMSGYGRMWANKIR